MALRSLDHDYVTELVDRLGTIPADAQPRWGVMIPAQMVGHLIAIVRFSMGRGPALKPVRSPLARHVFRPLVLRGLVSIPRNIPLPEPVNPNERRRFPLIV